MPAGDDRVPRGVRLLAVPVILALVSGFTILYLFPQDTATRFVWPIKAHLSSFMLASAYGAGLYFWVRVLVARSWHTVAAGMLPVMLFTADLGLATALHWDRFNHGNAGFPIWVGIYATVPFLMPVIWLWTRGRDDGRPEARDTTVPQVLRLVLAIVGAAEVVTGVLMFLFPHAAARVWPWPLTPLTARATASWFSWGLVWVVLVRDPRWSSFRIPLQATLVGLPLALVGVARAWSELDTERPATTVFLATAVGALVAFAAIQVVLDRRAAAG